MTKVEELVQSQLPPNSDWAKPTANLARAVLLRALEMPLYDFAEEVMGARFRPCAPHSVHAAAFWSSRMSNVDA